MSHQVIHQEETSPLHNGIVDSGQNQVTVLMDHILQTAPPPGQERSASARRTPTLTMLQAVKDSRRSSAAPNTTPVVFPSRQYSSSDTEEGGGDQYSRYTLPWQPPPSLQATRCHGSLITDGGRLVLMLRPAGAALLSVTADWPAAD
ncbi:unnamed protein product [Lota lota]